MSTLEFWQQHADREQGLQVAIAHVTEVFTEQRDLVTGDALRALSSMYDCIIARLTADLTWAQDGQRMIERNGG